MAHASCRGHRVAGPDIMSVGEPGNDSRIAAFWKRFPNVLKWYRYAASLLGNLSGWEARINLAILRMASDEEAAKRYVTQMPDKMFADLRCAFHPRMGCGIANL